MNAIRNLLDGVRGVIFDMDGTLVHSRLDFDRIRAEARVPDGTPILEFLEEADEPGREHARAVLLEHEQRAARECTLAPGVEETLRKLRERGYALALLTRNSRESVRCVVERFGLDFDVAVAREDARPKPSSEPVLKIAAELGLEPAQLLVVGDYIFDLEAGRAAGARTALLLNERNRSFAGAADLVLERLADLLPPSEATENSRSGQEMR